MVGAVRNNGLSLNPQRPPPASSGRFYVGFYGAWASVTGMRVGHSTVDDFGNRMAALFDKAPLLPRTEVELSGDILTGLGAIMSATEIALAIKDFYRAVKRMLDSRQRVVNNIEERNRLYEYADSFRRRHGRHAAQSSANTDLIAPKLRDMKSSYDAMIACEEARTLDSADGSFAVKQATFLRDGVVQTGGVVSTIAHLATQSASASVAGAALGLGMGVGHFVEGVLSYREAKSEGEKSKKVLDKIANVSAYVDRAAGSTQEASSLKAVLVERKQFTPGSFEGIIRAARYASHAAASTNTSESVQVALRLLSQAHRNESQQTGKLAHAARRIAYGALRIACGTATLVAITVLGTNPWVLVGAAIISMVSVTIWLAYISYKKRASPKHDTDTEQARNQRLSKDISMAVTMLVDRTRESTLARKMVKAVLTDIGLDRKYFLLHKIAHFTGNPTIILQMDRFMERQINHLVTDAGARQKCGD
ncbi:hypothetical protein [Cupriavidus pampae]|uniref:Uncharacterized protein n=1 Tax=Cupriavidus pampae TaxID=659251 RepID=A0ABN7ZMD6_9BURK|nr:hypothetical protein [Cupriavidus pampae]CAG9187119.1 hypothetical protein LMG32289_06776 [Cupriavidus pampae]